ncbi:unnamed protein product, partial [Ixodes persulcatus]
SFERVSLEVLRNGSLDTYAASLRALHLNSLLRLRTIEPGVFDSLQELREISIQKSILLQNVPPGVLRGMPKLSVLDFDSNRIGKINTRAIRVKAGTLILNHNAITTIHGGAFEGSKIAELRLRGNHKLTLLEDDAFVGLSNLSHLDLSETSVTSLPTRGLESLEVLEVRDTPTLREFPSVYHFRFIRAAHLTYPYHCCAFQFPETHNPEEHSSKKKMSKDIERTSCPRWQDQKGIIKCLTNVNLVFYTWIILHAVHRNVTMRQANVGVANISGKVDSLFSYHCFHQTRSFVRFSVCLSGPSAGSPRTRPTNVSNRSIFDSRGMEGTFHPEVNFTALPETQVTCGKLASRQVQCFPAPDAFNPCEDVMGTEILRVAVWFVVVAAVTGNLAVILVLLSGRMSVSKFLMCNLAFADLCMGAYLLLIAAEDLHTSGQYFNHAILWQHGAGCKVAGFLTVFASELSIYTLTVITLERWYAITYAVHLNRRLRLTTAARVMACGWLYAIVAATLPLVGVSSYSKTSICLPMENREIPDQLYLLSLLSVNGLAFLLICACYAKMYLAISGQRPRSHSGNKDTSVAKRMAMLVFTDFACWAPIAFFGLTAVAGYPLIDVPKSKILLVFFYPLNSCANPFLYAILTKQYRRDLSILLSTRGVCTGRVLRYTSSCHTTPNNRLLRGKDNSSTSRQTTELSGRTQKGSPHPIKNNFTKLGLHEEFLRRQSLLCDHADTPI